MPRHVVVDGSNIATEGRSIPSLRQLNEAVLAYMQEHPDDLVTVVVDATFGHRIDPREVPEFDAAVENNELVSPPAGAIGRGDAFVLTIANKANAIILSNDSFQEFHGDYPWLFDGDRLLGGKPVPHVGWVFVARAPVRGPVSRRAVRDKDHARASVSSRSHGRPSKAASEPMPVPKTPPPGARRRRRAEPEVATDGAAAPAEPVEAAAAGPTDGAKASPGVRHATVNDLLPFLNFVEEHPIGTAVEGTTESYSSHGAYVTVGEVRAYVPLRYLADPPPRSARDVLSMGQSSSFVVVSFNPPRRSVDLAVPGLQPAGLVMAPSPVVIPSGAAAELTVSEPAVTPGREPVPVPAAGPVVEPVKKAAKRARKAVAKEAPIEPVAVPGPVVEPVKKAAKRARKAVAKEAPIEPVPVPVPAAGPVGEPVKKAAKRARKAVAKEAPIEPVPVPVPAAGPVVEPVKKAAKRARKAVSKDVAGEPSPAPVPAAAAKKSRARSRTSPAAGAG